MLQIGSGKLFVREPCRRNVLRGVLYTNFRIVREKAIETAAGNLLPTSLLGTSRAVVYEFTELVEESPSGKNILVSSGMEPFQRDFASVLSFAANVICTPDDSLTEKLISGYRSPAVNDPPSKHVRRVFDKEVWCQESDEKNLISFIADLMALERRSFLAAMRAIKTYITGLHRIADDLTLAYTLLVASVESLAQGFDGHRGEWADYDERKKIAIDAALNGSNDETAAKVRSALLDVEHTSLARRFRDFTLHHIGPEYFREAAAGCVSPIGRSELVGALQKAYKLRSKYVHSLEELPKPLTLGAFEYAETTRIGHSTFLTMQGLARLARYVILSFVRQRPKLDRETYDYHLEMHGVVQMPLDPQYWLWHSEGLDGSHGRSRLEGLLLQISTIFAKVADAKLTDIRPMLTKANALLPQMKSEDRRAFLAVYILFNAMLPVEQREGLHEFESCLHEWLVPSPEAMIVHLILGKVPEWAIEDHVRVHQEYFSLRDKKKGFRAPPGFETGLSLSLAERFRLVGDHQRVRELIASAVENLPGTAALMSLEANLDLNVAIDWQKVAFPS